MNRPCHCLAILTMFLLASGCADSGDKLDIGEVTGMVTLNGQPLPDVSISFAQPGFRASLGNTDSEGRYELIYIRDIKGAAVGTHVVRIKRFSEDEEQQVEQLPSRYNAESELTRDVKPGRNEFDFELVSDVETITPESESADTP